MNGKINSLMRHLFVRDKDEDKQKERILNAIREGIRDNFRSAKTPEDLKLWHWHSFGVFAGLNVYSFFKKEELDEERWRTGSLYDFELALLESTEQDE